MKTASFLSHDHRALSSGDVMRNLTMLWLIGAAIITAANALSSPASTGTSTYEDELSADAKLAQIQAILEKENSEDDLEDQDAQARSSRDRSTPA